MKDVNGDKLQIGDIIHLHDNNKKYKLLYIDDDYIIYREYDNSVIWESRYDDYKNKIRKSKIFL